MVEIKEIIMRTHLDFTKGLGRKLQVEIPAEKVSAAFQEVYKEIQRNATIKGFRKGKAPLSAIRSAYMDRVYSEVVQNLVQQHYGPALDEHSLDPISEPHIHVQTLQEDQPFTFSVEFEVRPKLDQIQWEGLVVVKKMPQVGEAEIDKVLENIRANKATSVPLFEERPLAQGDIAVIDFVGFIDGAPLPNGSAQGHSLEIGSQNFIPGFEDALIGMRPGDSRRVDLQFPEEYQDKKLAGQPVQFDVTLKEIRKKSLPELDDELAKSVGPFNSLEDLRNSIKEEMLQSENKKIHDEVKEQILKGLTAKNPMDLPESMVANQRDALVNDFKDRLSKEGLPEEKFPEYLEKWNADFDVLARSMVHAALLIDFLADHLNLRATKEDFEERLQQFSSQTGIEIEKVKSFYSKERASRLFYQITEEKVIARLIDKALIG